MCESHHHSVTNTTFCFVDDALQKREKNYDDVEKLNNEKLQLLLYEELYKTFKVTSHKQDLCNQISFGSSDFSNQLLFLKDTNSFDSQNEELNHHFGENLVKKREDVVKYFIDCCGNPKNSLCESLIANILENVTSHPEISDELAKIKENFKKFNSTNNEQILRAFYGNEKIKNFILNDLKSNGIKSPIFRHILAYKVNESLIICVENMNKRFDIAEIHLCNDKQPVVNKSSESPNIVEPKYEKSSIFMLLKNEKFSLLKLENYNYQGYYSRELINHSFDVIAKALQKFNTKNTNNSLIRGEFKEIWKDYAKKYPLFKNSFADIFENDKTTEDVGLLFNSIVRKILLVVYNYSDNELNVNEIEPNHKEKYCGLKNHILKDETSTKLRIKEFITYIITLKGTPIIKAMAIRLFDEINTQTFEQLLITIKAIFLIFSENETFLKALTFMILGSKQTDWIPELILIKLERFVGNVSKSLFSKWERILKEAHLRRIVPILLEKIIHFEDDTGQDPVTFFDDVIKNLEFFDDIMIKDLKDFSLVYWKMITTEKYFDVNLQNLKKNHNYIDKHIFNIKKYLEDISNKYGPKANELLAIFMEKMKTENYSKEEQIVDFFEKLSNSKWIFSNAVLEILKVHPISEWTKKIAEHESKKNVEMDASKIVDVIKSNNETSENIKKNIDEIKTQIDQIEEVVCAVTSKRFSEFTEEEIKDWMKKFKENLSTNPMPSVVEPMAIVMRVFKLKTDRKLRATQLMTILTMWYSNSGILMQVSTGEGKTYIGVSFALLKFIYGQKIDVITSSTVLAERDALDEVNKHIFEFFGARVNHNCSENVEDRINAYKNSDIIYGTLGTFQRDYLLTEFYEREIMLKNETSQPEKDGKQSNLYHHFENILIDEVDSMLLDKGNNILYFSEDIPNMDEIEGILVFLRLWINRNFGNSKEILAGLDVKVMKKSILDYIYGVIDEDDIKNIDKNADSEEVIGKLQKMEVIDENKFIIKKNFSEPRIKSALSSYSDNLYEKVISFCRVKVQNEKLIKIPKYQKDFVLLHLENWIKSAVRSMFMKHEVDFIVERPRSDNSCDDPTIKIIDLDTGTDMNDSHWDDALHQMLQIKYNCALSQIGLKSIFVSNVSFLKKYKYLYGMTGTLGNSQERIKITKIYDIDYVTIPRFFARQYTGHQPVVCKTDDEWFEKIHSEVKWLTKETTKRSILIICETIHKTQLIRKKISDIIPEDKIRVYNRDYEEFDMKDLQPCHVIISTNLAGRGTDIKISEELNKSGGLHVILTFLPNNSRVEEQALGRAARSDNSGSGRIIFRGKESATKVKQIRNQNELKRLDQIATYYENFIKIEEEFFQKFQNKYRELKLENKSRLYLKNFIIQWALWLDKNSSLLDDWNNCNKKAEIQESFNTFLEQKDKLHPVLALEMFIEFDSKNKFSEGTPILNSNFDLDSFAHQYFRFYEMVKADQEGAGCKVRHLSVSEMKQLQLCYQMLMSFKYSRQVNTEVMQTFRESPSDELHTIESIKYQQEEIMEIIHLYENNIKMLMGSDVSTEIFNKISSNEVIKKGLYQNLLEQKYLLKPRISQHRDDKTIKNIAEKNKIDYKTLKEFLKDNSGTEFNSLNDLGELIKNQLKFSSRNEFWKTLKAKGILVDEVEYAVIDMKKIESIDPSAGDKIRKLTSEPLTTSSKSKIFYVPNKNQEKDSIISLYKINQLNMFSKKRINFLAEHDVLESNLAATFNVEKYSALKKQKIFETNDELKINDFNHICKNCEKIVDILTKAEILTLRTNNTLGLNCSKFDTFLDPKELSELFAYKFEIYELLRSKFSFRIALEKLACDLDKDSTNIFINLDVNPHHTLLSDLLLNLIFVPAKANCEKLLEWKNIFMRRTITKLLDEADIHESDERTHKLLMNSLHELDTKGEEIEAAVTRCICPLNTEKFFKNPEIFLEPVNKSLPRNKNLHMMEQKGLEMIISFRQKEEKKVEEKSSKWGFVKKVFLFIAAVAIMAIAIYALNAFIGVLQFGLCKLASYVAWATNGFKRFFSWFNHTIYGPIASIVQKVSTVLLHIGSTVVNKVHDVKNSAKSILQNSGINEDQLMSCIDSSKQFEKKFQDEVPGFLEKFTNSFTQVNDNIKNKISNLLATKMNDILPTIDKILDFKNFSKVKEFLNNLFHTKPTEIILNYCKSRASDFSSAIRKLHPSSNSDTISSTLEPKDNKDEDFVSELFGTISNSLLNEYKKTDNKSSAIGKKENDIEDNEDVKVKEECKVNVEEDVKEKVDNKNSFFENQNDNSEEKTKFSFEEDIKEKTNKKKLGLESQDKKSEEDSKVYVEKEFKKKTDMKTKKEVDKKVEKEKNKKLIFDSILEKISEIYNSFEKSRIIDATLQQVNMTTTSSYEKKFERNIKNLIPKTKRTEYDESIEELLKYTEQKAITTAEVFENEFVPLVINILNTTSNIDVYVNIIELDVPMDTFGLYVSKKVLEAKFNTPFVFSIKFNGSKFTIGDSNNKSSQVIKMEFFEGHFKSKLHSKNQSCNNNCLYYAISDQFEGILSLTFDDWRFAISGAIRENNDFISIIQYRTGKYKIEENCLGEGKIKSSAEGKENSKITFVETYQIKDHLLINNQLLTNNLIIPVEKDFILPSWIFQRNCQVELNVPHFSNSFLALINQFSQNDPKIHQIPNILIPAIVYYNLASIGQSEIASEFCYKQHSLLFSGQIHLAIEMKFEDQHNTTLQVLHQLRGVIFLQDLEIELNNLQTAQKSVVEVLYTSKFIDDDSKAYLLTAIENLPKNVSDENFKKEWKRKMICPQQYSKLLERLGQQKMNYRLFREK